MKTKTLIFSVASLLAGPAALTALADEKVSFQSLLDEMTSRDTIAQFPVPAYTCKQFSSYSRVADDPNNPETWFHNEDWSNFVRIEEKNGRFEHVLLDAKGPGAVVRFWNTIIKPHMHNGTLRVYIDGAETPVIEGKNGELISGGKLVGEPLSSSSSPETNYNRRGHNLYMPIPYAKSCKITYEQPNGKKIGASGKKEFYYYNINYRTYEPGTEVESFTMDALKNSKVNQTLKTLTESGPNVDVSKVEKTLQGELAAGESNSVTISSDSGGSLRSLTFKLEAEDLPQALRSTVMEMEFDGDRTVWCPLGDFFGTGYQIRPTQFWYGSVTSDGTMKAHWVMPYQKKAKVTLHNLSKQKVNVALAEIGVGDWKWDDRSMHFGASWHQYTSVKSGGTENVHGGRGAWDMNYVTLKGKGVYVGDTLTLFDCAPQWWGEGDEKIFVDNESFPSHFGTGTEDYYGYAWCRGEKFQTPFITQPDGTGDLGVGYVVNGRYRLLDGIPFNQKIQVDMEQWHWVKTDMDIAPTTYWYGLPGIQSNKAPDHEAAKHKVALVPSDVTPPPVFDKNGLLECEYLPVTKLTGGKAEPQGLNGWSSNAQFWWRKGKAGDTLELVFEAPKNLAGKKKVTLKLTQAVDYAQVAIQLNGKTVTNKFEGYAPQLGRTELKIDNGTILEGKNKIVVKLLGAHKDAKPGMMFGLDYIQVQ